MGEVLTAVVHAGEDWFRTRETKKEQRWQRRVSTALYPLPEQELLSQYAEALQIWRGCLKHCQARRSGRVMRRFPRW